MITGRAVKESVPGKHHRRHHRTRFSEQANARVVLLMLACLFLGAASGAFWTYHKLGSEAARTQEEVNRRPGELLPGTTTVLGSLTTPVELRFYSVIDSASDDEHSFAGRVDQLLNSYQREANGKVIVTHSNSPSYANASAAIADGMTPFNEEEGEPSFLGIAVIGQNKKEALAQLAPEWEPALEYDLTRAILKAAKAASAPAADLPAPGGNPTALEDVKRLIPNLQSVSLADATRMVRQASIQEFATVATQLQAQLKDAQQRLKDAQTGGSEAEQQAAMKNLQQVQANQTEQLQLIAAKSEAQIQALKTLKSGGQ